MRSGQDDGCSCVDALGLLLVLVRSKIGVWVPRLDVQLVAHAGRPLELGGGVVSGEGVTAAAPAVALVVSILAGGPAHRTGETHPSMVTSSGRLTTLGRRSCPPTGRLSIPAPSSGSCIDRGAGLRWLDSGAWSMGRVVWEVRYPDARPIRHRGPDVRQRRLRSESEAMVHPWCVTGSALHVRELFGDLAPLHAEHVHGADVTKIRVGVVEDVANQRKTTITTDDQFFGVDSRMG